MKALDYTYYAVFKIRRKNICYITLSILGSLYSFIDYYMKDETSRKVIHKYLYYLSLSPTNFSGLLLGL